VKSARRRRDLRGWQGRSRPVVGDRRRRARPTARRAWGPRWSQVQIMSLPHDERPASAPSPPAFSAWLGEEGHGVAAGVGGERVGEVGVQRNRLWAPTRGGLVGWHSRQCAAENEVSRSRRTRGVRLVGLPTSRSTEPFRGSLSCGYAGASTEATHAPADDELRERPELIRSLLLSPPSGERPRLVLAAPVTGSRSWEVDVATPHDVRSESLTCGVPAIHTRFLKRGRPARYAPDSCADLPDPSEHHCARWWLASDAEVATHLNGSNWLFRS
jgi:hypothetical protein